MLCINGSPGWEITNPFIPSHETAIYFVVITFFPFSSNETVYYSSEM